MTNSFALLQTARFQFYGLILKLKSVSFAKGNSHNTNNIGGLRCRDGFLTKDYTAAQT